MGWNHRLLEHGHVKCITVGSYVVQLITAKQIEHLWRDVHRFVPVAYGNLIQRSGIWRNLSFIRMPSCLTLHTTASNWYSVISKYLLNPSWLEIAAILLAINVFWLSYSQDFSYIWFWNSQRQQILHSIHFYSAKAFIYQQSHLAQLQPF